MGLGHVFEANVISSPTRQISASLHSTTPKQKNHEVIFVTNKIRPPGKYLSINSQQEGKEH
jgi:hypothetical protein